MTLITSIECGETSQQGVGWRAELAPDDEGMDEPEFPTYRVYDPS